MPQSRGYYTAGPAQSTYREGNSTIQFSVVPDTEVYNTTTNEPNNPMMGKRGGDLLAEVKRGKPSHRKRKGKLA